MTVPRMPVEQAIERILTAVHPLPPEIVPLADALGRVLTDVVVARHTHPAWRNSAMDGYAVHAADVRAASTAVPVRLTVAGTIAAGDPPPTAVARGTAWRIMTGAPVPDGIDSVIRVEDTDGGESVVGINNDRDLEHNIRPRGEDFMEGDRLIDAGTPLRPAHIGLAAGCGHDTLRVVRRPRIAILTSGNELVDIDGFDEVLAGRRIVNTNSYALAAAVRAAGGAPVMLGIAADNPASITERITGAPPFDVLITCGGISVGAFDYTRDVVARLGATLDFWRVRMRPGGPFGFGMLDERPWFGLPGNPVSALVTFELFVRPALLRMGGHRAVIRKPIPVRLAESVQTPGGLTHYLRAIVNDEGEAVLTGRQSSGMLTSMAAANALLIVPPDVTYLPHGSMASAIMLHDNSLWPAT